MRSCLLSGQRLYLSSCQIHCVTVLAPGLVSYLLNMISPEPLQARDDIQSNYPTLTSRSSARSGNYSCHLPCFTLFQPSQLIASVHRAVPRIIKALRPVQLGWIPHAPHLSLRETLPSVRSTHQKALGQTLGIMYF